MHVNEKTPDEITEETPATGDEQGTATPETPADQGAEQG